jgi:hypothetical protein
MMYAQYKMNVMFSEIEGELKQMAAFYRKDITQVDGSNFFKYKDLVQHVSIISKNLATQITHQRVMFDGKGFRPLAIHDQSMTPFTSEMVSKLSATTIDFQHLLSELSGVLTTKELGEMRVLSIHHRPRVWSAESQTLEISKTILYGKYQQYEFLPEDYKKTLIRYSLTCNLSVPYFADNKNKIKKILSSVCSADIISDNPEMQFFVANLSLAFLTQNVRKELNLEAKVICLISEEGKKYIQENIKGSLIVDGYFSNGQKGLLVYMLDDTKLADHHLKNQTGKTYKEHLEYAMQNYKLSKSQTPQPDAPIASISEPLMSSGGMEKK